MEGGGLDPLPTLAPKYGLNCDDNDHSSYIKMKHFIFTGYIVQLIYLHILYEIQSCVKSKLKVKSVSKEQTILLWHLHERI
jgi:hypothetical protein